MGRERIKSFQNDALSGLTCSTCTPLCGPHLPRSASREESPWASSCPTKHWGSGCSGLRQGPGVWEYSGSPWLPGVAILQRSAVTSPSAIGIRLKAGCVFPWAVPEESARRRSLGTLENSEEAACTEPFTGQRPRAGVQLLSRPCIWGLGNPGVPALDGEEDAGLRAGLLLRWVLPFVCWEMFTCRFLFASYHLVINIYVSWAPMYIFFIYIIKALYL